MMMPKQVTLLAGERFQGESKNAIIACNDYLRMGPLRSLRSLEVAYRERTRKLAPTHSIGVLNNWSRKYGWQVRAEAYDAAIEAEKDAQRKVVMEEGLALDYARVKKLLRVAEFLEGEIFYEPEPPSPNAEDVNNIAVTQSVSQEMAEDGSGDTVVVRHERLDPNDPRAKHPNVWARDVKGLGRGEQFHTVEIVRFNAAIFAEFRATLDDIAKETGGRRQKVEHSGDKENPVQHAINYIREVRPAVSSPDDS